MSKAIDDTTRTAVHAAWLSGAKQTDLAAQYHIALGTVQRIVNGMDNPRHWREQRMAVNVAFLARHGQHQGNWYALGEDATLRAVKRARMVYLTRSLVLGLLYWRIGTISGPMPEEFEQLFGR